MTLLRAGDSERVVALMRETAASELLPRLGQLAAGDVREKRPGDLVTVADEASEMRIAQGLAAILPGVPVVGEEAVAVDPSLLNLVGSSESAWIVDPLDGTANFAAGRDSFAMIVCLVERGAPVGGWILHPRSGRVAIAELGAGAELDGKRVRLEPGRPLAEMRGYIGWKLLRTVRDDATRRGNLRRVGELGSRKCAGLEYIDLLAGERQFSLYRSTKPWDHAAGALMLREAGGVAERFDGGPYEPAQPGDAGIVTAPDRARAQEIRELLLGEALPLLSRP